MKWIPFSTLILVLLLPAMLFSQGGGIRLQAGINISNVDFTNTDELAGIISSENFNTKYKPYLFVGVQPVINITDQTRFAPAIQFSQKGYEVKDPVQDLQAVVRYNYLDFMPQIELQVLEVLSIHGGTNIGFSLGEFAKAQKNSDWEDISDFDTIKDLDFGLLAGFRVHIGRIKIAATFNQGLSNISNSTFTDTNGDPIDNIKMRNRNIQIGLGYQLF